MNRKTLNIVAVALLLGTGFYAGCQVQRPGAPLKEPTAATLTPRQEAGRIVYMRICNQCHPGGNAGLGPSLNTKLLPSFAVKTQVRMGMGAMPHFDEQQISDDDLTAVVDYMDRLRGRTRPR